MKKQQLYQDLKQRILTLELKPGESLDETKLSQVYQISRTPLREVFRQLAGEGYLTIVNNKGASVSPMDYVALHNFFMVAPVIYSAIGRLAATNKNKAMLNTLKEHQKNFNKAVKQENIEAMVYWNEKFHHSIGEMANNPYLSPSYQRLLIDHARISKTFYQPNTESTKSHLKEANQQHNAMIDAIEKGDADAMVTLTQDHWQLSHQHIHKFIQPEPLPNDMATQISTSKFYELP